MAVVTTKHCRNCGRMENDAAYQELWGEPWPSDYEPLCAQCYDWLHRASNWSAEDMSNAELRHDNRGGNGY